MTYGSYHIFHDLNTANQGVAHCVLNGLSHEGKLIGVFQKTSLKSTRFEICTSKTNEEKI